MHPNHLAMVSWKCSLAALDLQQTYSTHAGHKNSSIQSYKVDGLGWVKWLLPCKDIFSIFGQLKIDETLLNVKRVLVLFCSARCGDRNTQMQRGTNGTNAKFDDVLIYPW